MSNSTILVVDDEQLIRWSLRERLTASGYDVVEAATGAEAVARASEGVDLVLLDYRLPDMDGMTVLKQLRESNPDALVILLTAYASIQSAVEAIKHGAYHYAKKPFDFDELLVTIQQALETSQLRREVKALRRTQVEPYAFERIIGDSAPMKTVKALLAKIAASPATTVLLQGETGTGKDLAAKAIHYNSERASKPFVNITCSALPETLLESELFGHERGAFTDARQQKRGLFETAAGGTAFLDEIGEMSTALQAKLLRFLEERTFKRIGGLTDIRVDVKVIAATHRNLAQSVKDGKFREDLYYRLSVMPVSLPPLRDRTGDVPLLVAYYIDMFNREFKKSVKGVTGAALKSLEAYPWPGNVRELRNAVERAMLLAEVDTLTPEHFQMLGLGGTASRTFELPPGGVNFEALERELLIQALQRARGNQTQAAQLLGMNRDQIRYRIEKFGIDKLGRVPPEERAAGAF
ncbi:MAG: sigma-54 dependent transcriptional regulator [Vicinamibacterales bacterium]